MATATLGGLLPEKLSAISAAGFSGLELMEWDLQGYDATEVRTIARDLGLDIVNYQPIRDFEGCPRDELLAKLRDVERIFDRMEQLGTSTLILCSNVSHGANLTDDHLAADLAALAERAAARGMSIGYEALSWGLRVKTYRQAWDLIERTGADNIGLVVDSFHTFALGDDPSYLATIPPDRIALVQLSDAPRLKLDVKTWSRHHRCLPGDGDFDVPAFVARLLATGYDGVLSLEIFNDEFGLKPVAPLAAQSLAVLRDVAARASDLAGATSWTFREPNHHLVPAGEATQ